MLQCNYAAPAPEASTVFQGQLVLEKSLEALELFRSMQPIEDAVDAVDAMAGLLKKLRRVARGEGHSRVILIELLYDDTVAYLEWLRRPEGRPGVFATIEEWVERVEEVLSELAGAGDEGVREAFWASCGD